MKRPLLLRGNLSLTPDKSRIIGQVHSTAPGAAQIGSRFLHFYQDKMIHISGSLSAKHWLRGRQDRFRPTW